MCVHVVCVYELADGLLDQFMYCYGGNFSGLKKFEGKHTRLLSNAKLHT